MFWTSGTLRDLQILILREFNAPKALLYLRSKTSLRNPFILTYSEFATGYVTAFPLVWPDADLKHGSVVSVKDPLWQAVCLLCSRNSALDDLDDDDLAAASERSAEESVSALRRPSAASRPRQRYVCGSSPACNYVCGHSPPGSTRARVWKFARMAWHAVG